MTYEVSEKSVQDGAPIEAYKFIGSYQTYRYTSYQETITVSGEVYNPVAITRNAVKLGPQSESQLALEVTLPYQNEMVLAYAYQEAPPTLDLELYRVHETDFNDTVLLWSGKVTSYAVKGFEAKLKIPSVFDYLLEGNVPTPRYQAPCNHIFTDARCGIAEGSVSESVTVTGITGNIISVSGRTFTENQLLAGRLVAASGEARMITSVTGADVTVSYPFSNIAETESATLIRGCDHSLTTCRNEFNNVVNFGGFPIVPNRNPFTSKI